METDFRIQIELVGGSIKPLVRAIPLHQRVYVKVESGHRNVELHPVKLLEESPHGRSTSVLVIALNQSLLERQQMPLVDLKIPYAFLDLQLLRLGELNFAHLIHNISILLVLVNVDGSRSRGHLDRVDVSVAILVLAEQRVIFVGELVDCVDVGPLLFLCASLGVGIESQSLDHLLNFWVVDLDLVLSVHIDKCHGICSVTRHL